MCPSRDHASGTAYCWPAVSLHNRHDIVYVYVTLSKVFSMVSQAFSAVCLRICRYIRVSACVYGSCSTNFTFYQELVCALQAKTKPSTVA